MSSWALAIVTIVAFLPAVQAPAGVKATRVTIDLKPGDSPTSIEPNREGMVPLAVMSTALFDALTIDAQTIRVGPTGTEGEPVRAVQEDIDKDGRVDLVLLFRVRDLGLKCGDSIIQLKGTARTGDAVEGSETIVTEGC